MGHMPTVDNSVDISNHSVSMTLTEPSDNVTLRGHNCKIEIGPGNTISNLLITGHNNKVFSKVSTNVFNFNFGKIMFIFDVISVERILETILQ